MAKQTGLVRYSGTMGDVRHFKIKGLPGDYAGLKGGPSGEQVLHDAAFVRTRENMNEFGGSAKAGKSVRNALSALMSEMSDSQVTGRLTGIMKKINLEDGTEARGYRAILISAQRNYLTGFQFNKNINFDSIMSAPYTLAHIAGRTEATATIPAFNPASFLSAPSGATHFRILQALAVVSDFAYVDSTGTYEPVDPDNNELVEISYSAYLPLDTVTANTVVTSTLPGTPTLTADVSVLQCLGIEFFQKVGPNYYLFNSGNCLKIQEIF